MVSRGLSAGILARHGQYRDAELLVCSAAALAAQTDLMSEHAETLLERSHVLAAVGQVSGAHSAATQALELHQRKGNLLGAQESLRYLNKSAPA